MRTTTGSGNLYRFYTALPCAFLTRQLSDREFCRKGTARELGDRTSNQGRTLHRNCSKDEINVRNRESLRTTYARRHFNGMPLTISMSLRMSLHIYKRHSRVLIRLTSRSRSEISRVRWGNDSRVKPNHLIRACTILVVWQTMLSTILQAAGRTNVALVSALTG